MQPRPVLAVDDIDLSDPDFWARPIEEREGAFATLRAERPVSFHQEREFPPFPMGAGYWALMGHAEISEASRRADVFSSARGATSIPDLPPEFLELYGSLINTDDPRHMRLRRLVSTGFTPIELKRQERDVERAAKWTLDMVMEKGECDFVTDIATPFPLRIICDMMGIPESQNAMVLRCTNIILGAGDPEFVADEADAGEAVLQAGFDLVALMRDLYQHRLKNPTDDLTSILAHAEIEGDRITEQEMGCFFILLATAGNETTRNAISHGMKAFCDNPDQRAIWEADFDGVTQTAVEEIVRWSSPVIFMRRTTTCATTLGGQDLGAGEKVLLFYYSGNRDAAVFTDPYRFDVKRSPNDHVGFGGPGVHFCLGANLARREIAIMFRELFRRLPDLQITGEPDRLASAFINGIKHMPCQFTPGGSA